MENNIDSYSEDGKILLKCPNVARYRIKEGCERVDEKAFVGCPQLKKLYVPYTFTEEAAIRTFELLPTSVDNFVAWNRPYVDEVYDTNDLWYNEDHVEKDNGVVYNDIASNYGNIKILWRN